uniref:hypothetical protein n=1 Tax=Scytothamnus australis TaxID=66621 RepID=UPI002E762D12|nr:hypothetical protein V2495_pgp014 [Scytothamnus australis]WAM64795.1 hypothetical protein [Scytothamnus australis]
MIFWDNLLRYPRFFISSMIGLILVLLTPIIARLKTFNNKREIFLLVTFTFITLLYILKEMLTSE